jgi:hypothetical protein
MNTCKIPEQLVTVDNVPPEEWDSILSQFFGDDDDDSAFGEFVSESDLASGVCSQPDEHDANNSRTD